MESPRRLLVGLRGWVGADEVVVRALLEIALHEVHLHEQLGAKQVAEDGVALLDDAPIRCGALVVWLALHDADQSVDGDSSSGGRLGSVATCEQRE